MTKRPILFSDPMVRAILAGTKTQTRRVVKVPKGVDTTHWYPRKTAAGNFSAIHWPADDAVSTELRCPYGQPGDRLWVREAWADSVGGNGTVYRADMTQLPKQRDPEIRAIFAQRCMVPDAAFKWKPSIYMPRALSRILLEITAIRVERLNDISKKDALDEGIDRPIEIFDGARSCGFQDPVLMYRALWESINGAGSWDANPWVWVVEFRRIAP